MSEEAGPYARVWRTYQDETQIHDTAMVEDSRDSVGVLPIFAGLFSTVVTTFVVQTSQNLQLDFVERALANGLTPTTVFNPAGTSWVNGLCLVTALIAVLVKQWLYQYMSIPLGTPRDRSLIRHYRYMGLEAWHVPTISAFYPSSCISLLHFSSWALLYSWFPSTLLLHRW
ncbi:hypothetical protein DFS33DRAFT_1447188 [Desarmillaria ectypa]|nr:hypothetical protein DFS33DRAFT_1447188 [Desarmillaria ectypa]